MNTQSPLDATLDYITQHYDAFLERYKAFLRIPSISTDPSYKAEVQRAAEWLTAVMSDIGLHNCRAIPSEGQQKLTFFLTLF